MMLQPTNLLSLIINCWVWLGSGGGGKSSPFIILDFISSQLQGVKRYITSERNQDVLCTFQSPRCVIVSWFPDSLAHLTDRFSDFS